MDGKIRTKENCPRCKSPFSMAVVIELGPDLQLCCPPCKTRPNKYYIDLYSKGNGKIKLYSDQQGNILSSWDHAERILVGIRYEIDQKRFDATKYVKKELRHYLFETQIETWYQNKLDEVKLGNLAGSYVRGLRRYRDYYLRYFKGKDVREIKTFHIDEFYRKLPDYFEEVQRERKKAAQRAKRKIVEKSSWSLKYIKNVMGALENFFATLLELERIVKMPGFPSITIERKVPKWTDRASQVDILAAIPEEDRDIFNFLSFQGLRPGEARALKIKDFDLEDESFTTARTFSDRKIVDRTKSKVVRPRAINPVLMPMLWRLCEERHPEAFIFINQRTKKPYSEDATFDIWDKARKSKGLDLTLYQATRHSFASNLLKDGVDISVISKLLGHTDIRTTMIYAHADLATQKVAFRKQTEGNVVQLRRHGSLERDRAGEK
jgi:integrase